MSRGITLQGSSRSTMGAVPFVQQGSMIQVDGNDTGFYQINGTGDAGLK